MRTVVIHNPIAGRGRAMQTAATVASRLSAEGHDVSSFATLQSGLCPESQAAIANASLVVVIGGDGTMRVVAGNVVGTGAAVYQIPFGTENLFAREFGMSRSVDQLERAVEQSTMVDVDVGVVNESIFLMMVSIGLDAEVIHDLHATRSGSISHRTYLRPIARQFRRWRPAIPNLVVDDEEIHVSGPGMVVVANSRQYGFRFDPAQDASMTDGLLDVVFLPFHSRLKFARLAMAVRRRRHVSAPGVVLVRGRRVMIAPTEPQRVQVDGEATLLGSDCRPAITPLDVSIRPASLRVLVPG